MKFTKEHLPAFEYVMKQLDKQIKTMERYKGGIDFYFESPYVCDMVRVWSEETQDVNHDDAKMIASEITRDFLSSTKRFWLSKERLILLSTLCSKSSFNIAV